VVSPDCPTILWGSDPHRMLLSDIAELDGTVQVDMPIIDVISGEIVWTKLLSGSLEDFTYLAASFAQSILEHLGLPIDHSTIVKIKKQQKAKLGGSPGPLR
jgi:hypothetical protein